MIKTIKTKPFYDQKMGTSGLRKKAETFLQLHYTENFIQSVLSALDDIKNKTLVVGGDGRYLNNDIIQKIIKIASANGVRKLIIGQNGIFSTPAASHIIRKYKADGGFILSASHNPGGPSGDCGIKYNVENGGPAPEKVTDLIFEKTQAIKLYKISDHDYLPINHQGTRKVENTIIDIIDPVQDYADLMQDLFDFESIRSLHKKTGFRMIFDALHAVTGPYAQEIFEKRLGFPSGTVHKNVILPDFGGKHPDPNPIYARDFYDEMMSQNAPDFGAASDGDGDRNMIMGSKIFVSPSDSLAILAANAHLIPVWKKGIKGVARSMPTSQAVDSVAQRIGVDLYETPTGWKFFGNLIEAGKISICGEESFGTGASHVAEKDGIWAVLLWLNILAVRRQSVHDIVKDHWKIYGRHYYSRHDYEEIETQGACDFMEHLSSSLQVLQGKSFRGMEITHADNFVYCDPIDGSVSSNQGIRIFFDEGRRIIFRMSGTGTSGSTLRVYIEKFEKNPERHEHDIQEFLKDLVFAAEEIGNITYYTKKDKPTLIV